MPTDIKSYKIKYGGGVGKSAAPFRMKADNNDPMTKNYGPVAPGKMRAFGTKDSEMLDAEGTDTSTALNYGAAVGSSPAKGFFKNLVKGVKNVGKKAIGAVTGKVNDLAGIDTAEVAPHGDEAHTGGNDATAEVTGASGVVGGAMGGIGAVNNPMGGAFTGMANAAMGSNANRTAMEEQMAV